jgi:mono/diheme cytochrome c family protein
MPAYSQEHLGAADLVELTAYLNGLDSIKPGSEEVAAIQRLVFDPTTPKDILLRGKAAIRRSCGACHAQPDRDDLLRAFRTDAEATELVAEMLAETNLSLEEAAAIAHYILAIRHGTDPGSPR